MIPATQIERVPASELVVGDLYAKTKNGPAHEVMSITKGPRALYIELGPKLNKIGGGFFYRRIRPRHTTLVWRQRHE
jgi:hypothetical protein